MKKTQVEKFHGPVLKAFLIAAGDSSPADADAPPADAGLLLVGDADTDGLRRALQSGAPASASAALVAEQEARMLVVVLRVGSWEVRTIFRLGFPAIDEWVEQAARSGTVLFVLGDRSGGQSPAAFVPCAIPAGTLTRRHDEEAAFDLAELLTVAASNIRAFNRLACAAAVPGIEANGFAGTVCAAVPVGAVQSIPESEPVQAPQAATLH